MTTDWVSFLTLRTGSFISNYFWIFIIIGLISIIGTSLATKIRSTNKDSPD
ncbi:MAG: hypothetical protein HGN29_09965 [Asgard group archaeon]|nr:hypothetical protein [Asgard group archaeon]